MTKSPFHYAEDDPALMTSIFGYFLLSRGLGNILSTPISTALDSRNSQGDTAAHNHTGFQVGNGRFEKMIVYVGTCFACAAAMAVLGWVVDVQVKRRGRTQTGAARRGV
jgi:MFS transporter, MCT family, solute carrier family 16 (monocarboxylic acid transporters), member 10